MKSILTIFVVAFFCFSVKAQILFNPATYNPAALPSGMAITEVDGTKYLQVTLNGWENKLQVSATNLTNFEDFYTTIQYKAGTSGVAAASMVSVLQLVDTTADMYTKLAEISVKADPNKKYYAQNIIYPNNTVNQIKFALRDTSNWTAVSGDTLLIGLIEAMPKDNGTLLDPATIDPTTLPEGMEIVEVESEKMLKMPLMGWNTFLPIQPFKEDSINRFKTKVKFENGDSVYNDDDYMLIMSFKNDEQELGFNEMEYLTSGINEVEGSLRSGCLTSIIQVAVLETKNWTALDSAYVYVGKIEAYERILPGDKDIIEPTNICEIAYNQTAIIIDGEKDNSYTTPNNIAQVAWGMANQLLDGAEVKVNDNPDTYAQWYSTFDDTMVYFYVNVKDNDLPNAEQVGERSNNGIEMIASFYKVMVEGEKYYSPSLGFSFIPGQSGLFYGGNGLPDYFENNDTTNIRYASNIIEGGYTIEVAIPLITLFAEENSTIAETKYLWDFYTIFLDSIGLCLDFNLLDADAQGNLKSILCWGNNTGFDLVRNSTLNYRGDAVFTGQNFSSVGHRAAQNKLKVFPNPFNSRLVVNSAEPIKTVKIYNLVGQLMLQQTANGSFSLELNVQNLKSGMYVVQTTSANGNLASCKVFKE